MRAFAGSPLPDSRAAIGPSVGICPWPSPRARACSVVVSRVSVGVSIKRSKHCSEMWSNMADPAEIAEVYEMIGLAEMSGVAVVDGMDESACL